MKKTKPNNNIISMMFNYMERKKPWNIRQQIIMYNKSYYHWKDKYYTYGLCFLLSTKGKWISSNQLEEPSTKTTNDSEDDKINDNKPSDTEPDLTLEDI